MTPKNELAKTLSLEGKWEFCLGETTAWGSIQVPGCWEAQGYSKFSDGPAHFRRSVWIPGDWAGEPITIEFEAVSYACSISCNGVLIGQQRGLWTPFSFEISAAARPGAENLIELEIYKPGQRYPMRAALAGFLPDIGTTFGGIWQPAALRACSLGWEDLRVDPDPATGTVRVRARLAGKARPGAQTSIFIQVDGPGAAPAACLELPFDPQLSDAGVLDAALTLTSPERWSPEQPALYTLRLELRYGGEAAARVSQRFGFRSITAAPGLLLLNEQPVLLRGLLSWGWLPEQICPAYTLEQARAEIRRVKALGFNLIKLCLVVPNSAYFDVADEEGIFLWEEMPLWLPEITPALRASAPSEYAAITRQIRHHPSLVLYSLGCELDRSVDAELINRLNDAVRAEFCGGLVCDNSGSGESYGGLDFDLSDFTDYHPYYDLHYFEPLLDNWRRDWLPARPWIFGEFSDSDGYREPAELIAANGGQLPWWMTADNPVAAWRSEGQALVEVQERLAQANLPIPPAERVRIAAEQSLLARKYTLETLRRRDRMGGYVITGLRDTPVATSGVFDDFERAKSPAADWLPFNADAVLCLDSDRRRRWTHGGDRPAHLDLHNHWAASSASWHIILSTCATALPAASQLDWALLTLDGRQLAVGRLAVERAVQPGVPAEIGALTCQLPALESAAELRLTVRLEGKGLQLENSWPVWVYPAVEWPAGLGLYDPSSALDSLGELTSLCTRLEGAAEWNAPLVIASAWSEHLETYLRAGGRVLLLQQGDTPLPARRGPFWREGLKIFSPHPLWQAFPQRGVAALQFFGLAGDVMFDPARLSSALPELSAAQAILSRLDEREYTRHEYLFEAQLGRGRLLACSLRVQGGAGAQPAGLKHNVAGAYLLAKMIEYLRQA